MEQEDVTSSALRAMLPEEESAELPRLARAFLDFFRLPDLLDFPGLLRLDFIYLFSRWMHPPNGRVQFR